jgi:uncharacterized membrane protein YraQ (UPF0718 family)
MFETLRREGIYFWYYFTVQFEQIAWYYALGVLLGSAISVFGKEKLYGIFARMKGHRLGFWGVAPASLIGIASPLCMYGTIPIAASFAQKGMPESWLAAFMMSSVLLNPQLLIYSAALGARVFAVRLVSCFLCGVAAGVFVRYFFPNGGFFRFEGFETPKSRDVAPNPFLRLFYNVGRNVRATLPYFLIGVALSALFQLYVPQGRASRLFGGGSASREGFGVLMAATLGVPLYVCGGGTIPLLMEWLADGMSIGAAAAFMLTGPATKITNLGALGIVLGAKSFALYIAFVCAFAFVTGVVCNLVL